MSDLNFTTRSEYLVWRATWRCQYDTLSGEIARHKKLRREVDDQDRPLIQSGVERMKVRARGFMQELEDAKVRAAELMGRPRTFRHEWVYDYKHHQWVWVRRDLEAKKTVVIEKPVQGDAPVAAEAAD